MPTLYFACSIADGDAAGAQPGVVHTLACRSDACRSARLHVDPKPDLLRSFLPGGWVCCNRNKSCMGDSHIDCVRHTGHGLLRI